MGGGWAMSTAEKIAGIGVGRTGFTCAPAVHPAEQSLRNVSRSASASLSSQGPTPAEVAPLHSAAPLELDDSEFAYGGDLVMTAGEPMARVVFGGVPTFEEAKEATTELKEAIDKICLSSDSSQCKEPSPGSQVSVLSRASVEPDTKSCVIDAISNPSVPKHAIQAFQLLSTSPQVQEIPQKVEEFANSEAKETPEEAKANAGNGSFDFMGLLMNFKITVADMVSSVSNYLRNIFPTAEKEKSFADADGNSNANFMGGTFVRLAVLVIMVVMLKRV